MIAHYVDVANEKHDAPTIGSSPPVVAGPRKAKKMAANKIRSTVQFLI